jgi:cytidine deaminase
MTQAEIRELVDAARAVLPRAYAPYSGFRVGAAVRTASGAVFAGCNVENASYPVGLCAERSAIAAAVAAGEREVVAVAVATGRGDPCAPCGMCRQALNEFGPGMDVILAGQGDAVHVRSLRDLLPEAFGPAALATPPGDRR